MSACSYAAAALLGGAGEQVAVAAQDSIVCFAALRRNARQQLPLFCCELAEDLGGDLDRNRLLERESVPAESYGNDRRHTGSRCGSSNSAIVTRRVPFEPTDGTPASANFAPVRLASDTTVAASPADAGRCTTSSMIPMRNTPPDNRRANAWRNPSPNTPGDDPSSSELNHMMSSDVSPTYGRRTVTFELPLNAHGGGNGALRCAVAPPIATGTNSAARIARANPRLLTSRARSIELRMQATSPATRESTALVAPPAVNPPATVRREAHQC